MITIRPIRANEVDTARDVIIAVCFEFFGQAPVAFEDMDDIDLHYSGDEGAFLVLASSEKVVGTGAIRRLDDSTCELKRMWFLKEYRGRGWGREMAYRLFDSARQKGYTRIRLDTSAVLTQAIGLYRGLGFQDIERYNDGPGTIFMEKTL